jgi:hypothetical protein
MYNQTWNWAKLHEITLHLIYEKIINDVTIDCFAKIVLNKKSCVMQHETAANIFVNGNYNYFNPCATITFSCMNF